MDIEQRMAQAMRPYFQDALERYHGAMLAEEDGTWSPSDSADLDLVYYRLNDMARVALSVVPVE